MTDIARLGLAAETQPIKDAAKDLDRLSLSAKSAGAAADKFSASSSKMGAGLKGAASGASGAQSSVTRLAEGYDLLTGKVNRNFMAISKNIESWNRIPAAANGATSALNRLGKSASDNINKMQATPGNIAAQFQDIGVTAAGGMNPMIIALQQGTQLGAAMSGGLGDLGKAFKQILSPINLMTIGLVGLAALGIQMVDWAQLAADALNGLADVIVEISPYLALLAAGLALIYAPAIIAGIGTLTVAMYNLAAGILAVIGLPALLVIGFVAMVAAAVEFRDELTEMLGFDIVQAAQDGVNFIINAFIGAYKAILATWDKIPAAIGDLALQAANWVIRAVESMVNGSIQRINALTSMLPFDLGAGLQMGTVDMGQIDNPWAGAADEVGNLATAAYAAEQGIDRVGMAIDAIKSGARTVAGYMRQWAGAIGAAGDAAEGKGKKSKSARAATGKSQADLWAELLVGADKQMRGLEQAGAQIGVYGEALSRLQFEQQLFNEAQDKGIVLTAAMAAELTKRAAAMAQVAEANRKAAFMEDLVQDAEMLNLQLERERGELGLTGAALIAYRYETEKLVAAKRAHIDLSPEELEAIRQAGILYGEQADAIAKASQALEDNKATVRGVFDAIAESITKGTNLWDNLANVFDRVVDRMVSRLLDDLMDAIFQVNNAAGGGGGLFGSLLGLAGSIGGAGGGGDIQVRPTFGGGTQGNTPGVLSLWAKGGAFTNSVVDSPTMFKFANGGKFGVMGEAGPEAVLPLKRGSDGSLGVQVQGGSNDNAPSFTFDLRGAVVTQDILDQMNQIASQQANVAVNQNNVRQQRQSQRALGKR